MKKKRKSKVITKSLPLKKSLKDLIKDEDGFVSKETILKVGLSTVAALGVAGALPDNSSGFGGGGSGIGPTGSNVTHSNVINANNTNCVTHHNVTQHYSY